ncbi:CubicO group peptidase, beta-lactamase class C family [Variovorax sp. OV329]|nr:CubicO group peptidase, beta-lactamase class C family [Variovorax sp. OV329]
MKLGRIVLGILALVLVAGAAGWSSLDKETRGLLATLPTNRDVLFWSQPQRDAAFRALDRLPILAKARVVAAADKPSPLPAGAPLALPLDLNEYMASQRSAAIVILQDGKLRLERYGLDFDAQGRWTSFSVAKSITSTLMGAAVRDGQIRSLEDKVSDYIQEMKGSAYDQVSIRQLLTMTSGVKWNEDYADPRSDVARFNNHQPEEGVDSLVSYLRKLPRVAPAGTRWNYSTGETNLVGVLLSRATGKPLATYLSEKIWVPAGMEQQATWILSRTGQEISGCCIQAATRDFARFGQFILDGAKANGQPVVPDGWLAQATTRQADIGYPGRGYGYQWWTYDDGSFSARGIFGQGIFIDPRRKLVIASNANWGRRRAGPHGQRGTRGLLPRRAEGRRRRGGGQAGRLASQGGQCLGRAGIGGEEGFHRQFLQRHVHRCAEDGGGADEAEHALRRHELEGHDHAGQFAPRDRRLVAGVPDRIGRELAAQGRKHAVARDRDLLGQPFEQMLAPLRQVGDTRRQALGMQAQSQYVDGRLEQFRFGTGHEQRHHCVGGHQVPVAVHRQGRKGLVPLEHQVHRLPRRRHGRIVQRALAVHGRIAGGHQQGIALAQRHFQALGQAQHHLAAGRGAAGFHVAQMAGGNIRLLGEIELAQAPLLAPVAQVLAEWIGGVGRRGMHCHGAHPRRVQSPKT